MTKANRDSLTFKDLVLQQVECLDEIFCRRGKPVLERPFEAARFVVKHCIVKIDGHDKDDYLNSVWFGAIYWPILKWYKKKYGRELLWARSAYTSQLGLILFRGLLLGVEVPITVSRESGSEETFDIHFPIDLLDGEEPLDMLVTRPAMRARTFSERAELGLQITEIVTTRRRIWSLLVVTDEPSREASGMKRAIFDHLESAAGRALSASLNALGLALFDLRMCCECVLKLHLSQTRGRFKRVHDFDVLLSEASDDMAGLYRERLPSLLRDYPKTNELRYGVAATIAVDEFYECYRRTLEFVEHAIKLLTREFEFTGMVAVAKKLPWARLGSEAFLTD